MGNKTNQDTHDIWNGKAGRDWAANQHALDYFLQDALDQLLAQLPLRPGAKVLEIGSGSGTLSMTMARAVAPGGSVLGLDVSRELIALAERRTKVASLGNLSFRDLDIQSRELEEKGFDICTAQFGMMFFSDPVMALMRIRDHLKPGALVAFNGWADQGNPWFAIPLAVAERHLGALPTPPSDGPPEPGPLAFSDVSYVTELLHKAGYTGIEGWTMQVYIRHPGGLEALMSSIKYVGPISTLYRLKKPDADTRAVIAKEIETAFSAYVQSDGGVCLPAGVTMFRCLTP